VDVFRFFNVTSYLGTPDSFRGRYFFRSYLSNGYLQYVDRNKGHQVESFAKWKKGCREHCKAITDIDLAAKRDPRYLPSLRLAANEQYESAGKVMRELLWDGGWNRSVTGKLSDILDQYHKGDPADPFNDMQTLAAATLLPAVGNQIESEQVQRKRNRAQELRRKGLSWAKIGEALGVSVAVARKLENPTGTTATMKHKRREK
jgi:hypothetical protein